jgi:hypothetical protein
MSGFAPIAAESGLSVLGLLGATSGLDPAQNVDPGKTIAREERTREFVPGFDRHGRRMHDRVHGGLFDALG